MEQQFEELLPDSLIAKRFPIGDEEVIKSAPRERFVDFYTRFYYTPARMTFIVVGDVDTRRNRGRIRDSFSIDGPIPPSPGKNPDLGAIRPPEGLETAVIQRQGSHLHRRHADRLGPALQSGRRHPHPRLSNAAAGTRPRRRSAAASSASPRQGSPGRGRSARRQGRCSIHVELGSITSRSPTTAGRKQLPVIEREFRRAVEFGFTDAESPKRRRTCSTPTAAVKQQPPASPTASPPCSPARSTTTERVLRPGNRSRIAREGSRLHHAGRLPRGLPEFWDAPGIHLVLTTKEEPENATRHPAARSTRIPWHTN